MISANCLAKDKNCHACSHANPLKCVSCKSKDFLMVLGVCTGELMQCAACSKIAWWRHQMEIFSTLLAICAENSPVPGEFPAQRPVTRNFDVFFDLRPNKRLNKQWWGWWFETISHPLWRHRNGHKIHPIARPVRRGMGCPLWVETYNFMMMSSNGNIFRVTGQSCGKFTGHRWISHTKASDAGLWCFLWSVPE